MTSKQTLLKALKEAEGPSRELDAMTEAILRSKPNANPGHFIFRNFPEWGWRGDGRVEAGDIWWQAQRYTSSLDVCLALQERVLPGCDPVASITASKPARAKLAAFIRTNYVKDVFHAHAPAPAIAWLIAIVEALIAQEQNQ